MTIYFGYGNSDNVKVLQEKVPSPCSRGSSPPGAGGSGDSPLEPGGILTMTDV